MLHVINCQSRSTFSISASLSRSTFIVCSASRHSALQGVKHPQTDASVHAYTVRSTGLACVYTGSTADSRLLTTRARSKKSPTSSMARLIQAAACVVALMAASSSAYVPASPSNETSSLVAADDFLQINWLPMGTSAYKDALSRQLANTAQAPVAGYRGALVHFVEANATSGSNAPWIALINCDDSTGTPSGSGATLQVDAVTLAVRAGAETAILYSLEAETCVLDRSFIAGNNGTLDLYVTASQASARSIIQQFM
jgi:hypothetical protein